MKTPSSFALCTLFLGGVGVGWEASLLGTPNAKEDRKGDCEGRLHGHTRCGSVRAAAPQPITPHERFPKGM